MSELDELLARIAKGESRDNWFDIGAGAIRMLPDLAKRLRDVEEVAIERRDIIRECVVLNGEVIAKNQRLTAERDELLKDRARLDWIEAHMEDVSWTNKSWHVHGYSRTPEIHNVKPGTPWGVGYVTHDTLRAAIDDAMSPRPIGGAK